MPRAVQQSLRYLSEYLHLQLKKFYGSINCNSHKGIHSTFQCTIKAARPWWGIISLFLLDVYFSSFFCVQKSTFWIEGLQGFCVFAWALFVPKLIFLYKPNVVYMNGETHLLVARLKIHNKIEPMVFGSHRWEACKNFKTML